MESTKSGYLRIVGNHWSVSLLRPLCGISWAPNVQMPLTHHWHVWLNFLNIQKGLSRNGDKYAVGLPFFHEGKHAEHHWILRPQSICLFNFNYSYVGEHITIVHGVNLNQTIITLGGHRVYPLVNSPSYGKPLPDESGW